MPAQMINDQHTDLIKRASIQKVAAGPEYSKDLSFDAARAAETVSAAIDSGGALARFQAAAINGIWLMNQQSHNLFQNPD